MQSTYITWLKVCAYHKIPKEDWRLDGKYNYIEFTNGSRIDLLDVDYLPSDPLYERFGSLEYSDGALEEAGEIHELAHDVLKSRIGRHMNDVIKPTMAITGNPKKNWTYRMFYKPWAEGTLPPNQAFIQALYKDNQHTASMYGEQLESIRDNAMRQRLKDGDWEYDEEKGILVSYEAITDIWGNETELSSTKYLTADIARFGSDKVVIGLWEGYQCYRITERTKQDTITTADLIDEILTAEKIPRSRAIVDEDGVGGGVVDSLRGIKGFMANRSPILENRKITEIRNGEVNTKPISDNYFNLKAQCAWKLAEKIEQREIAVVCRDRKVMTSIEEELSTSLVQKDPDKDGKLQLIPKDEVKEKLGRSPDYADMMIMRMYFDLKGQKSAELPNSQLTQEEKEYIRMKAPSGRISNLLG